jgi:hypothetical protein
MKNTNLVIIGSRSRPDNAVRAFDALKKVSKISDFVLIINEDQKSLYPEIDGVTTHVVDSRHGVNGKFNTVVPEYLDQYKTITGIDDDCLVQTDGWDKILYEPIKKNGFGISYGNDGVQGQLLPTKVMISTNITKTLGYWCPPKLFHSFADDFWKFIGESLSALYYFNDVNMEHLHWMNGKAPMDETYSSNTPAMVQKDRHEYGLYLRDQLFIDLDKLNKALQR